MWWRRLRAAIVAGLSAALFAGWIGALDGVLSGQNWAYVGMAGLGTFTLTQLVVNKS